MNKDLKIKTSWSMRPSTMKKLKRFAKQRPLQAVVEEIILEKLNNKYVD